MILTDMDAILTSPGGGFVEFHGIIAVYCIKFLFVVKFLRKQEEKRLPLWKRSLLSPRENSCCPCA